MSWVDAYPWVMVERRLRFYRAISRTSVGSVQTMYNIVAVGDMVRFYTMNSQNPGNTLAPFTGGRPPRQLSFYTEPGLIDVILCTISAQVRSSAPGFAVDRKKIYKRVQKGAYMCTSHLRSC